MKQEHFTKAIIKALIDDEIVTVKQSVICHDQQREIAELKQLV